MTMPPLKQGGYGSGGWSRATVFSFFSLAALLLFPAACSHERLPPSATADSDALRVLFIGNSYTYFNDLPALVEQLARSAASPRFVAAGMVASGGQTLEGHWKKGRAARVIRDGQWDFVVLQEQSQRPLRNRELMYRYARLFDAEIKKAGAKTVFFLTWARKNEPELQKDLSAAYYSIAKELGAGVAPVGVAWEMAMQKNHKLRLHWADRSHPNREGSYLAACVLWAVLQESSPVGLPTLGLGSSEARYLQEIAREAVQSGGG